MTAATLTAATITVTMTVTMTATLTAMLTFFSHALMFGKVKCSCEKKYSWPQRVREGTGLPLGAVPPPHDRDRVQRGDTACVRVRVLPAQRQPLHPCRFRPRLVVPGPTDGVCTPPHPPCGWPPRRRSGVERPRAGAGHGGARATCRPPCPAQLPPLYAAHPCPLVPATVVHALPVDRFRRLGWSVLFAFKGPSPLAAFLLPPPSPFSLSPCPSFSTTASRRLA